MINQTHLTLLDQAESPLQTFILLSQLQMLRNLNRERRETPKQTIDRLFGAR